MQLTVSEEFVCKYCGRKFVQKIKLDQHTENRVCLKVKKKDILQEEEKAPLSITKNVYFPASMTTVSNIFRFPEDLTKIVGESSELIVAAVLRVSAPLWKWERMNSLSYFFGAHKVLYSVNDHIIYKVIITLLDGTELKIYSDSLAWCPPSFNAGFWCRMAFFGVKQSSRGYKFINSESGGWGILGSTKYKFSAGNVIPQFKSRIDLTNLPEGRVLARKKRDYKPASDKTKLPWLSFTPGRVGLQIEKKEESLNEEQARVFKFLKVRIDAVNCCYDKVDRSKPNFHFINGLPGTGKSYLLDSLYMYSKRQGINCKVVSFTRMVANMYKEGSTIHSYFGIKFNKGKLEKPGTVANPVAGKLYSIVNLRILFIDEICSVRKNLLELIDDCLRRHHATRTPFGGILVIAAGDFNQLPPVVYDDDTVLTEKSTEPANFSMLDIFTSNQVHIYALEKLCRMRKEADQKLLALRASAINSPIVELDPGLVFKDLRDGINFVYGPKVNWPKAFLCNSAIICLTNFSVFNVNVTILSEFFDKDKKSLETSFKKKNISKEENIRGLNRCDFDHLVEGIPLFCTKNTKEGLSNGSFVVFKKFKTGPKGARYATVQELDSNFEGKIFDVPRFKKRYPFDWGFALTVHKSQGRTFDKVCVVLEDIEPFMHGQLTVALTRVRSIDDLRIVKCNNVCKNFIDKTIKETAEKICKFAINKS